MKAKIEMTDTYGGEANYSWVKRYEFEADGLSNLAIVRRAKSLLDISGWKCKREQYQDTIQLDPYGACLRVFITFEY